MTARSRHDELRARYAHATHNWQAREDVFALLDEVDAAERERDDWRRQWEAACEDIALVQRETAAAEARAEKAEQALRELKALTLDPTHAARMITRRQIRLIIDPALAAAAGDTGDTE